MIVALGLLLGLIVVVTLICVIVFKDQEFTIVKKEELNDLKHEYAIMEDALTDALVNPEQAQLHISNAFYEIKLLKTKEIK